jgi:MoaA/NifB/PqqE/SkfB family radical SAM enzyme
MTSPRNPIEQLLLEKYLQQVRTRFVDATNATDRRLDNLDRLFAAMQQQLETVNGLPYAFFIEPANNCNLRCPLCPTGSGRQNRPRGLMSMQLYKSLVDAVADAIFEIHFGFQGEPMLHPDLAQMIAYAHERDVYTRLFSNFNIGIEEAYQNVVRAGLDRVTISLDGIAQESYTQYRVQGNLSTVLHHIALINKHRELQGGATPVIEVQTLALQSNENELEQIAAIAQSAGADIFKVKLPTLCDAAAGHEVDLLAKQPKFRMYDHNGVFAFLGINDIDMLNCRSLYLEPGIVCWDGSVAVCCRDYNAAHTKQTIHYGSDYFEIWNGPVFRQLRTSFRNGNIPLAMCENCPTLHAETFVVYSNKLNSEG